MEIVTFVELDIGTPTVTYRFGYASEEQLGYDHIPSLKGVNVRSAVLDPGESIGERETITISFIDHLHRFDVDDFYKGTFWTKFRARYPNIEGATIRVKRGRRDQTLTSMDTYLYVADRYQISRSGATITAKDPLSLLASKAAQAPKITQGEISANLLAAGMAFTLTPAGIGNLQYPAAGKGVLAGKEVISFTRVNDNITITSRGENITAIDHEQGAKFQLALVYNGATPSAIINDLLVNYTEVNPAWITLSEWQQQVDAFINRLYTSTIAEPTSVKKLLDELCAQIGLVFFWDAFAKQIRLRPLLQTATTSSVTEEIMEDGSFDSKEQPDKRVSQAWTYYGQRDPCRPVDEPDNYRRAVVKFAPNEADFAQPAIRKIFSRWISFVGRSAAERLNDLIISRYQVPPRKFNFSLFRNQDSFPPQLGAHISVAHWFLVNGNGDPVTVSSQVTSVEHDDASVNYDAEEVRFAGVELEPETDRYVFIENDCFNVNLRDLYNQIYTAPNNGDNIYFIVAASARVGSLRRDDHTVPAMTVGNWPEAVNLFLTVNGRIQGVGGRGGGAELLGLSNIGQQGGTAFYTRRAITITNNGQGTSESRTGIWGGGGGGSVIHSTPPSLDARTNTGGGGAGFIGGLSGQHPDPARAELFTVNGRDLRNGTETNGAFATLETLTDDMGGFPDGWAGQGGTPGQAGFGAGGVPPNGPVDGGPAGIAIDGVSFVTFAVVGSILGPQVN